MSKNSRKNYRNVEKMQNYSPELIQYNSVIELLNNKQSIIPLTLKFELKFFLMSISTLLCTNIHIHKQYLNNYNFKFIILISFYLSKRLLFQIFYHFHIQQLYYFSLNKAIILIITILFFLNVIYIFCCLVSIYSIYNMLPLFALLIIIELPLFIFDNKKKYENPPKEMFRIMKKVIYLSIEFCYYTIYIPVLFSIKKNFFFNANAIFIYTILTWIDSFLFLFSFNYFKISTEFHFYILSTGDWKNIKKSEIGNENINKIKIWRENQLYEKGNIIEYKDKYYIALEDKNIVEPNNLYMMWMYKMFKHPKEFFNILLILSGWLCFIQGFLYIGTKFNIMALNLLLISWFNFEQIYFLYFDIIKIFNNN